MGRYIQDLWGRSRLYRGLLIAAIVYTLLRLVVQAGFLGMLIMPGETALGDVPEWVDVEGPMIPADLQIYLDAAQRMQDQEELYLQGSLERLESHYPYAPSFALAFIPFTWVSPATAAIIHTVLHFVAYAILYMKWGQIFEELDLKQAHHALIWLLPVWLLFSSFWTDLGYLNIYLIIALFATLSIEAVLRERLGASVLWLSILLQIKPHWSFALAVPLLLGRHRFFFKLLGATVGAYIGIVLATILALGPAYGLEQHRQYFLFLARLSPDFPWRTQADGFLGYNHSVKQIVVYFLGFSPGMLRLADAIKLILLAPLGLVSVRHLLAPAGEAGHRQSRLALDFAFALYLGVFIWLDMVWEVSLGVALLAYLLGTVESRWIRTVVTVIFFSYALLDPVRVFSFGLHLLGVEVIAPGPYILTDPAIYVPVIMLSILAFYTVLVVRLWRAPYLRTPSQT